MVDCGPCVQVEVILLRTDDGGHLEYRVVRGPLGGDPPDHCARHLAELPAAGAALLHSTSWRYDPRGGVVLSYVASPDCRPDLPARPLADLTIARSADPDRPAPPQVTVRNVAAHGVRHLALLMRTDPVVRAGLLAFPPLAAAVRRAGFALAGQLTLPADGPPTDLPVAEVAGAGPDAGYPAGLTEAC